MKIEGIHENDVECTLGTVVCERYQSICNTGGDQDLLHVPQLGEDVVPVFTLFTEARCQDFFRYGFARSSAVLLYDTLRVAFLYGKQGVHMKGVFNQVCVWVRCPILSLAMTARNVNVFDKHIVKRTLVIAVSNLSRLCG